jgi:hypothetical protein
MEKILHEVDSIWKNYYIIQFPWNKYYAGTNSIITRVIGKFLKTPTKKPTKKPPKKPNKKQQK